MDFGQYTLVSRLGRGGMGETWKARRRDLADAPLVVIKRMLPDFAEEPEFIESFVNEARLTATMSHPNIAQVLDFGRVEGEYFFVIELVHGRTVEALLRTAPGRGFAVLPAGVACAIAIGVLEALDYAHTRRGTDGRPLEVVHRDISPDNVLLSFGGEVKVVDFGVAKARMRGRAKTQAGTVKGKYSYFSPEQARGESLDGRSDIFAVGVMLYRLLSGTLPFGGDWPANARRLLRGQYAPIEQLRPGLSAGLARIVARALESNAQNRFQSAALMAQTLRAVLDEGRDFDQASLQAFIHFVFLHELEGERVRPAISGAEAHRIERWKRTDVHTDRGAVAVPAEASTQARLTVAGTVSGRRPSVPTWRWLAGAGFLTGILVTVFALRAGAPSSELPHPTAAMAAQLEDQLGVLQKLDPVRARGFVMPVHEVVDGLRQAEGSSNERDALRAGSQLLRELSDNVALGHPHRPDPQQAAASGPADAGPVDSETELPDTGPPKNDVVKVPSGETRLPLALGQYNLLDIHQPEENVFRKVPPVDLAVDLPHAAVIPVLHSERGYVLSGLLKQSSEQFKAVSELRFLDFRPFPSHGLHRAGSFMVSGVGGELRTLPALRLRPSHGHFVVLQGLKGSMRLKLRAAHTDQAADPRSFLPPWVAYDCDGAQGLLVQEELLWPENCAVAAIAPPGSTGAIDVFLDLYKSPLAAIPPPQLEDEARWNPVRTPAGMATLEDYKATEVRGAFLEARAELLRNEAGRATFHAERCLTFVPDSIDCQRLLAFARYRDGQESAAVAAYSAWLELVPGDPDATVTRAALSGVKDLAPSWSVPSPLKAPHIKGLDFKLPPTYGHSPDAGKTPPMPVLVPTRPKLKH